MDSDRNNDSEMLSLYQKNEIIISTILFLKMYSFYLYTINNLTIFDTVYTTIAFGISLTLTALIVNYTFYLD